MKKYLIFAVCVALLFMAGCKKDPFISKVVFSVSPNGETVRVKVLFTQNLRTDLGGTYEIEAGGVNYGSLEIQPWTQKIPFSIGFRMNVDVLNHGQDFVNLQPADLLLPLQRAFPMPSLTSALMQLRVEKENNAHFDIYQYLDVANHKPQWIGMAVTFNTLNQKYFPVNFSGVREFVKDANGVPQVYASFYGPKTDGSGKVIAPAGVALFANVMSLAKKETTYEIPTR